MAEYIEYHPLKFWLDPASIAEIVAHIQTYLVNNPINSTTEIETIIHDYLIAHPELIGGVDSVNGQTGEVVLTADNISAGENVTIKDVLDSLQDQIDDIVASIPSDYQQLIDDVSDLKSAIDSITIDQVVIYGNNLMSSWENGDISTSGDNAGAEISSGSYYRTPAIPVDVTSVYLATVANNAEETPVVKKWANTTYCIVCCYSDSAFLGVASPQDTGIAELISGTTYIRIAHALAAQTANFCVYRNNYVYPSGHDNTVETLVDADMIGKNTIEKDRLSFLANSNSCIATKDDFLWYIFSTSQLISDIIPFQGGTYIFEPVGTDITFLYVKCFDESKTLLTTINIASANFGKVFTLPASTKYINCVLAISNGVLLSKLTSFNVYRRSARFLGFSSRNTVVDVADLPSLPPLALTGQSGGGIVSLGHGGVSSIYAEDSIESFYALAKFGYSGTEIDIQFTKDHVPVCWHNPSLSTLTGGTANDHIYDYTLDELDENFDFRTWWDVRDCFRSTVARFEEVCILARAYGWTLIPDKMTSAEGAENEDLAVIVAMLKKYKLDDKIILNKNFVGLRQAFPDAPLLLSAMESSKDDEWMNSLLNNTIPDHCHTVDGNLVVDDDYTVYTTFNWSTIKANEGLSACIDTSELCDNHNVKLIWYTVETPEDIYQLVVNCPSTSIVLTGLYTIPDGMNQYIGISDSNTRYGLNRNTNI